MEVPATTGLGYGQPEDPLGRATADGGRVRRGGGMRGTDIDFKCIIGSGLVQYETHQPPYVDDFHYNL